MSKQIRYMRGGEKDAKKLTLKIVREIRCLYMNNESITQKQIAKLYGVNASTVSAILRNKFWVDTNYTY